MVADLPVTPGERKGQHQTFPKLLPLKLLHLNGAVGQRLCPMTPCDWLPNTVVWDGERTLSMCSRSTTNLTHKPPIRRVNG